MRFDNRLFLLLVAAIFMGYLKNSEAKTVLKSFKSISQWKNKYVANKKKKISLLGAFLRSLYYPASFVAHPSSFEENNQKIYHVHSTTPLVSNHLSCGPGGCI